MNNHDRCAWNPLCTHDASLSRS